MNSLVSVIIPVYNVEKYLEECLDSIITQTYRNLEIIIVDDKSTDNSLEICKKYREIDERIVIIEKEHAGLGAARNEGINNSTGEYIMFLDSDDWIKKDAIYELVENINTSNCDVVFFDLSYYNQCNGEYIETDENKQYLHKSNFVKEKLDRCLTPAVGCSIYNSTWYKHNIPPFPRCVYEDSAIYPIILMKMKSYSIIPKNYYIYRINTGKSLSQNKMNNISRIESLKYLMKYVIEYGLFESYKDNLYNFCKNRQLLAENALKNIVDQDTYNKVSYEYEKFFNNYFYNKL